MKFTETGRLPDPGGPSRSHPHGPNASIPRARDHRGWAAHWGQQTIRSMQATDHLEQNMLHAVRSARLAWYHACRAKGYRYWDVLWLRGGMP